MTKQTPIILDRLASALARHGVRPKRMQLLESVAAALGHRNSHEMAAADAEGALAPPEARFMGRQRVPNVGMMLFLQDPDGTVFAVDEDRFDAQEGRAADWILSPLGGALDVSALRRPQEQGSGVRTPLPDMPEASFRPDHGRPIDPLVPAYMTSGCCEVASVTQEDLEALGLPFGEFEGSFFPLTDEEVKYIAEDVVDADDGLHGALIGYAVLYRSAKHLMPTIEIAFQTERDGPGEFRSRDEVLADATAYAERIRPKVAQIGGEVLMDTDQDDRVCIEILVPMARAMEVGDFDAWKERLAWIMVDPDLPTVLRDEIVHSGREFQVSLSWIGEGDDGDYDPTEPYDHPLVRFDVRRLVDGEWQDVDDGSYCTQVPAYAERKYLVALARSLATELDVRGGAHPKRLMESMSWRDLASAKGMWAAQRDHDAKEADAFVAEATYGHPDQGTSISLRRRADGSVRCEVYLDLDCVALIEAQRGMAEVRAWLRTLPSDVENAEGPNQTSHALAPQWTDHELPGTDGVRWMLVPEDESEEEWFAQVTPAAPFARRFVPIAEMDV